MDTQLFQNSVVVAQAPASERAAFIRRTYGHLAGAILAFVLIEIAIFQTPLADALTRTLLGSRFGWLAVLVGFGLVSWVANTWARSNSSVGMQYLGLGLYVGIEAIIFVPLLYVARHYTSPDVLPNAAIITGLLFGGLTYTAFTVKSDFSFLRGFLTLGFFVALGAIVCSILFGFTLGVLFSAFMVLFAAGSILYTTANIQNEYYPGQHVAAALALFAGVALLFWYVLRILMSFSRR